MYLTAQNQIEPHQLIEKEIEQILEHREDELSGDETEQLFASLYELIENPIDLNTASADRLTELPGIKSAQAVAIVRYREKINSFESVDELIHVESIGRTAIERLRPFIEINAHARHRQEQIFQPARWFRNGRFSTFTRYRKVLEKQQGYTRPDSLGGFLGSPVNYYQRFHYRSNHVSMNLTQQKAAGEQLQSPFSFHNSTWHTAFRNMGRLQMLVAGHYNIRLGHGLLLNNRPSFGKGRNVIRSLQHSGSSLRGYTSSSADQSLRGIAFSFGNRWNVTGFYSNRKRSASIADGDSIRFPSASVSYNTINMLERKDNTHQITLGGRFGYNSDNLRAGFNAFENRFSRPVAKGSQPYQRHAFQGTSASGISLDIHYQTGNIAVIGEAAGTHNRTFGFFTALVISPGNDTDFALSWRHYDPEFQGVFGSAFSEQSGSPRNESGLYLALQHRIFDNLVFSSYIDQFRFPDSRFQTNWPSTGYDWFTSLEYRPVSKTSIDLSIGHKTREQHYRTSGIYSREKNILSTRQRTSARLHLTHQANRKLRVRFRTEMIRASPPGSETETGYLMYQDIRWHATDHLQIDTRLTYFHTEGFDSRLYHFENDLLYLFSSTMLFDQGQRLYILFNFRPADFIQIWFKAATTIYENRNEIGSGLNRIQGNRRSDIGVQIRITI